MKEQDTKAKFIELMEKVEITPRELSKIGGFSFEYIKNVWYSKDRKAPRWMLIVVEVVKRLKKKSKKV